LYLFTFSLFLNKIKNEKYQTHTQKNENSFLKNQNIHFEEFNERQEPFLKKHY
jgi:hypothetical protein